MGLRLEKHRLSGKGPEEARVLVVDAQNAFCHKKGPFGDSAEAIRRAFEHGIRPLVERARSAGVPVGWTQAVYEYGQFPDYPALAVVGDRSKGIIVMDPDTGKEDAAWQVRIYEGANSAAEPVFKKNTYDPFRWHGDDNGLGAWLGIAKNVVICGFTTTHCVSVAAAEMKGTGRTPTVPSNCVGVREKRLQDQDKILAEWGVDSGVIVVPSQECLEFIR
jgi:nicotinamidase-related amidase